MNKVLWLVVLLAAACGGGTTKSDDPRCETLCANTDQTGGDGVECTSKSVDDCKTQCGAKIYGVSTLCGNCLLEDASFTGDSTASCESDGTVTQCMITNDSGTSCTYDQDNKVEIDNCVKLLFPNKTMSCEVEFDHDLSDCTDYCVTAK